MFSDPKTRWQMSSNNFFFLFVNRKKKKKYDFTLKSMHECVSTSHYNYVSSYNLLTLISVVYHTFYYPTYFFFPLDRTDIKTNELDTALPFSLYRLFWSNWIFFFCINLIVCCAIDFFFVDSVGCIAIASDSCFFLCVNKKKRRNIVVVLYSL